MTPAAATTPQHRKITTRIIAKIGNFDFLVLEVEGPEDESFERDETSVVFALFFD
jgi:hypothetical protein